MIGDPIRTEEPNAVTNRKTDCYSLLAAISYPFYVVHASWVTWRCGSCLIISGFALDADILTADARPSNRGEEV